MKEGKMLEKLEEFSIWQPLGDVFDYLYTSSNIWVPIILFFVISLLSVYLLHKLINLVLSVKVSFKTLFSFFVKAIVVLLITGIIFSLGFYLYSQYQEHEKEVVKKELDLGYLLK